MRGAQKDDSGVFDSILVHFGSDKARFHPAHLKINRSIITVPTAWRFKPMTEVSFELQLPPKAHSRFKHPRTIRCRGIIVECRPLKQKGKYVVDLLLTDLPARHASLFNKLVPSRKSSLVASRRSF